MHHLQLHAPAGHHPGGDGAVQSAGEQAHGGAAHTHGQSARAGHGGGVDVGVLLPDLHIHGQVGIVHIHRHMGEPLGKLAAHGLAELDGGHGEELVGPLALHLEAAGSGKVVGEVGHGGLHDGLHGLFAGDGPGHGGHAEHLAAGGKGALHVALVILRLHVDGALAHQHPEIAEAADAAADVVHELVLEGFAVEALQDHLAQLQKEDLIVVHRDDLQ